MPPIFVFGTGRCGSTHLQRLLTLNSTHWIWGEHHGFLMPLLRSVDRYEKSREMEKFVFSRDGVTDQRLIDEMFSGAPAVPWINRLSRKTFGAGVAALIDSLFRENIPAGWSHWGFKEIRYGIDDDSPRILMQLFPGSVAAFTFRDPEITLQSIIQSWHSELLEPAAPPAALEQRYRANVARWIKMVLYFLELKQEQPGRLVFVSADKLGRPIDEFVEKFGLIRVDRQATTLEPTNARKRGLPEPAIDRLSALFSEEAAKCEDVFGRACHVSEDDFGGSPGALAKAPEDDTTPGARASAGDARAPV
jgi:hypothetical protein